MQHLLLFTFLFLGPIMGRAPSALCAEETPIAVYRRKIPNIQPPTTGRLEIDPESLHFDFAPIEAGDFMMGSHPEREPERSKSERQRKVTITKPFWLQTTEVTESLFEDVMGYNPVKADGGEPRPDFPVSRISYTQVTQFIAALQVRRDAQKDPCKYFLPSEAQWEYAVRAGTNTSWFFGDDKHRMPEFAWTDLKMHDVGQLEPSPWGLYDVYGNVAELVADRYSDNLPPPGDQIDPIQTSGVLQTFGKSGKVYPYYARVTKGGNYVWTDLRDTMSFKTCEGETITRPISPWLTRSAARHYLLDDQADTRLTGFRLAKTCPDSYAEEHNREISGGFIDLSKPSSRSGKFHLKAMKNGGDWPYLVVNDNEEYEIRVKGAGDDKTDVNRLKKLKSVVKKLKSFKEGDQIVITGAITEETGFSYMVIDDLELMNSMKPQEGAGQKSTPAQRPATTSETEITIEIPISSGRTSLPALPTGKPSVARGTPAPPPAKDPWRASYYGYEDAPYIYGPNGGHDPADHAHYSNGYRIPSPPRNGWQFGNGGERLNKARTHVLVPNKDGLPPKLEPFRP